MGEDFLTLAQLVDIVHFAEAGPVNPDAAVDIAFIEGSIATPEDAERILHIRANSRYLISIGAYRRGGNRTVDAAIDMQEEIDRYLRQPVEQPSTLADAREGLLRLHRQYSERLGR